jgi:formate dehydrogenase assembly factor FdhD
VYEQVAESNLVTKRLIVGFNNARLPHRSVLLLYHSVYVSDLKRRAKRRYKRDGDDKCEASMVKRARQTLNASRVHFTFQQSDVVRAPQAIRPAANITATAGAAHRGTSLEFRSK